MYYVYDSEGNFVDKFPSIQVASWYKATYGNSKWFIKNK